MSLVGRPAPLLLLFALGCTSHVHAEDLEIDDEVQGAPPAYAQIPAVTKSASEPTPEPAPEPASAPVIVPGDAPRLRLLPPEPPSDTAGCEAAIDVQGLPAVHVDGSHYVHVLHSESAGAEFDGQLSVEWRDAASDEVTRSSALYDGYELFELYEAAQGKAEGERACSRARTEIARKIRAVNAELSEGYRAMSVVPVQLTSSPANTAELLPVSDAPHARPVEVFYRNGYFISRIRGVEVLQRDPKVQWLGDPPELTMDSYEPTIVALFHDPHSGLGVVELSYESASCMSDPTRYTASLTLAPEVVAMAEPRAAFVLTENDIYE